MEISFEEYQRRVLSKLPNLSNEQSFWMVRANGGEYFSDFYKGGFIAIGWNNVTATHLHTLNDEAIKEKIVAAEPMNARPGSAVNQMKAFTNNIRINDIVIVPSEAPNHLLVGKVTSNLYVEDNDSNLEGEGKCPFIKRKKVNWIGIIPNNLIDPELYKIVHSVHTITDITSYKGFINRGIFDSYVEDEKMSITFRVKQTKNIKAKDFITFVGNVEELISQSSTEESDDLIIKANVQSPGPIELIGTAALMIGPLLLLSNLIKYGGEVEIKPTGFKFKSPGSENGKAEVDKLEAETRLINAQAENQEIHNQILGKDMMKNFIESAKRLDIDLPVEIEKAISEVNSEIAEEQNIDDHKR